MARYAARLNRPLVLLRSDPTAELVRIGPRKRGGRPYGRFVTFQVAIIMQVLAQYAAVNPLAWFWDLLVAAVLPRECRAAVEPIVIASSP